MSKSARYAATGLLAATALIGWTARATAEAMPFSFNYTFGGDANQTDTPSRPGAPFSNATSVTRGTDRSVFSIQDVGAPPAGAVNHVLTYALVPLPVRAGTSGATVNTIEISWDGIFSFIPNTGNYAPVTADDVLSSKRLGTLPDPSGALNTQQAQFTQTPSQSLTRNQPSVGGSFNSNPSIVPVSEPASAWLFGVGLLGLGLVRRKRNRGHICRGMAA